MSTKLSLGTKKQAIHTKVNYAVLLLAGVIIIAWFVTAPPVASAGFLAEQIGYMFSIRASGICTVLIFMNRSALG